MTSNLLNSVLKPLVRAGFTLTPRKRANRKIRQYLTVYNDLALSLSDRAGQVPVRVPVMPGVDADMREWSFFMVLEHHAIVNRFITGIVDALSRGERPATGIDPKTDVMPSDSPGREQWAAFNNSVAGHLNRVARIPNLRGTPLYPHPLFGWFTAHQWHCMFAFHLRIHLDQARYVAKKAES